MKYALPRLTKIFRQRNLVIKPNGERHWPLVGFRNFRSIAPIRQYQLVQETRQLITVNLAADALLTDSQKAELTALIHTKLGYPFELDIQDQLEDLPMQPNGKFEEFVCRAE